MIYKGESEAPANGEISGLLEASRKHGAATSTKAAGSFAAMVHSTLQYHSFKRTVEGWGAGQTARHLSQRGCVTRAQKWWNSGDTQPLYARTVLETIHSVTKKLST